jgi:nitroreductase
MDIFEAIDKRHSYRGDFLPGRIDKATLRRIVQAGLQAPSGCNEQTTTWVIIDDRAVLEQIADIVGGDGKIRGAAAILVCLMDPRPVWEAVSFGVEDYAASVENVLLAVTALGYATVWIDGVLRVAGRAEAIGKLLGVPANLQVRVILPVGRPAAPGTQREKRPFAERAWFNRYGAPEA